MDEPALLRSIDVELLDLAVHGSPGFLQIARHRLVHVDRHTDRRSRDFDMDIVLRPRGIRKAGLPALRGS